MTMAVPADFDPETPVIEAVRQGDAYAFEELVRRHDRWVRGVIYGVLGNRDAVDDVAQQAWANAWKRISDLRDPQRWRPWLYRLARNAAIDAGRDATRRRPFSQSVEAEPVAGPKNAAPGDAAMRLEQKQVILDAIQSLPALYREPFVLRHLQDWSYREIAETMDIPVDTVETRLVRARRLLREALAGKV
jgi:RNA polymerase sigma-70 factor (ECF subfamily)